MIKDYHDTAILVFSRPSIEEGKEKTLVSNQQGNTRSINWLRNRTIRLAGSTNLPFFISEKQVGATFGERLANSFQHIFSLGFQNVIAIGNDCGALTKYDLRKAAFILEKGKSVVGPDLRNGAYLIGLSSTQFEADQLAKLPWRTKDTFESLKKHLKSSHILEAKGDINSQEDLRRFVRHAARVIRRIFHLMMASLVSWKEFATDFLTPNFLLELVRRGPPKLVYI